MSLTLSRYLVALGYGTRKEAERIVRQRRVTTAGGTVLRDTDRYEHDDVCIDRTPLEAPPGSVILLHKPVGAEQLREAVGRALGAPAVAGGEARSAA